MINFSFDWNFGLSYNAHIHSYVQLCCIHNSTRYFCLEVLRHLWPREKPWQTNYFGGVLQWSAREIGIATNLILPPPPRGCVSLWFHVGLKKVIVTYLELPWSPVSHKTLCHIQGRPESSGWRFSAVQGLQIAHRPLLENSCPQRLQQQFKYFAHAHWL